MRDTLDALKEEVRQPLTVWENIESERIQKHEANISEMVEAGLFSLERWADMPLESMQDRLKEIESEKIDDFEEYANDAAKAKDAAITQIKEAIEKREKYDAEQAELSQLRANAEAQEKKDREETLRKEGEEKAKKEAAETAEVERKEREEKAATEKARSYKAEKDAIEAKEKAERNAKEAKESSDRKATEAAKAERDRIEDERIAEEQAAKKREADKAHRAKINNAAADDLISFCGLSSKQAKKVVTGIAKGGIRSIRISY